MFKAWRSRALTPGPSESEEILYHCASHAAAIYLLQFFPLLLSFPGDGGNSSTALDYCSHYLFDERDERKKVLIVLTSGQTDNDVQEKAHGLRLKGVRIYSVGVGKKTNEALLLQLASDPKFMFPSGLKLSDTIISRIKQDFCQDKGILQ